MNLVESRCANLQVHVFDDKPGNNDDKDDINEDDQTNDVPDGSMVRMQKATVKAVKKQVKNKHLRHRHYVDTINNLSTLKVIQNNIMSKNHVIMSVQQKKIALSAIDDKRWVKDDGINTLAFGHYKTL